MSVAGWVQVVLNGGALITGGVVWKMYFENLRATVSTKEAQVSLANQQIQFWRDKAEDLEKRSPEVVERVLNDRISIREAEIKRLTEDREHDSEELERKEQEVAVMRRAVDQTEGFRLMLAMEEPDPDDPDYQEYLDYLEYLESQAGAEGGEGVVKVEVERLGTVGVDSGQLLITDPCYIDGQWLDEPFEDDRVWRDTQTGDTIKWGRDFTRFDEPLQPYGETPTALLESGRLVQLPPPPRPEKFPYSYNGACRATLGKGYGELVYTDTSAVGAGVVFQSGWGDGFYPVYGEKHDGRIVRVYVNTG
jgi:hypothetical protein